jgi:hypothetical protein
VTAVMAGPEFWWTFLSGLVVGAAVVAVWLAVMLWETRNLTLRGLWQEWSEGQEPLRPLDGTYGDGDGAA